MKKCNGTGLVLKICEMKNNVWKKYRLSIQNSIDNHIKITYIKPNFASLSDIEIAGSLINQGFPFSVLAKCLQRGGCGQNPGPKGGVPLCTLLNKNKKQLMYTYK